jgi:glycosyltransferase involved in cell wall biosynthesis
LNECADYYVLVAAVSEKIYHCWSVDGKFFRHHGQREIMRCVTYGPFPDSYPRSLGEDFRQIRATGFQVIRLFEMPSLALLDAAAAAGLSVFGGLKWAYGVNFIAEPEHFFHARVALAESLKEIATHRALVGVYVANEIPAELVRWIGAEKVRHAIEELILLGKSVAPHLLFAYANYPSTEYLEPENADFTACNVYLEKEEEFRSYLPRLHHVAGDRPLVIAEFGLDSRRNGQQKQAAVMAWGIRAMNEEGVAGLTIYAWSDHWWNADREVLDWDFGLVDRSGVEKLALASVRENLLVGDIVDELPLVSVVVCTRNGSARIGDCLRAISLLHGHVEAIVVDDGSSDGTAEIVARQFPWVRLIRLAASGLSAARNAGAAVAQGEIIAYTDDDCEPDRDWIVRLCREFSRGSWDAVGGPNLSPRPLTRAAALISVADGSPTHVMLSDLEAEHLAGCNLAVKAAVLRQIGGFDEQFTTAGDDVDFCWRLSDAGLRMGFAATAFVWHHRRTTFVGYLRQQKGYGKAEALLIRKHPQRFHRGQSASWKGFVYQGGPLRAVAASVIYYGIMGTAGYQSGTSGMQPKRPIERVFRFPGDQWLVDRMSMIASWIRRWTREWGSYDVRSSLQKPQKIKSLPETKSPRYQTQDEFFLWSEQGHQRSAYLETLYQQGWQRGGVNDDYDVKRGAQKITMATELTSGTGKRTWIRCVGISRDEVMKVIS